MDIEFFLGGDKKCSRKKKRKKERNVPEPDHEEGDTILSIYFLNIFYRNQKTVLARNAGFPMLGRMRQEYCQEFADSETLSQTTRKVQHPYPLHLTIVLADTGRKMHIETEHTTGELASWHLPGACQMFSDKEQISLSTKDDRVGNNWSMNFIKPKKNQLDQLPSHQASQPETPPYKYALTSIQCLP